MANTLTMLSLKYFYRTGLYIIALRSSIYIVSPLWNMVNKYPQNQPISLEIFKFYESFDIKMPLPHHSHISVLITGLWKQL